MRVYIAGHYSRNKGNVTLLYVMVSLLEKIPGITELVISSFEPANTRKIYSWPCVEWPFNFRSTTDAKGIHKILEGMWMLLKGSGLALLAILVKMRLMSRKTCYNLSSSLKAIGTSDLLISPGGHMFTNYNHFPGITAHFFPLLSCLSPRCRVYDNVSDNRSLLRPLEISQRTNDEVPSQKS